MSQLDHFLGGHITFIILDSEQNCTLLQRETLFLYLSIFSKVFLLYIDLFEKTAQKKGSQCLCSEAVQERGRPMGTCLLTKPIFLVSVSLVIPLSHPPTPILRKSQIIFVEWST